MLQVAKSNSKKKANGKNIKMQGHSQHLTFKHAYQSRQLSFKDKAKIIFRSDNFPPNRSFHACAQAHIHTHTKSDLALFSFVKEKNMESQEKRDK